VDVPLTIPARPDEITGALLFASSCDPLGGNPFGDQLFAMRQDGTGLRQVTAARGRERLPAARCVSSSSARSRTRSAGCEDRHA